ncbi:MAG: UDP-N-acetylmuramoyl-L-alanine--D-glutamate ligase [Actinomycetota bacterium]
MVEGKRARELRGIDTALVVGLGISGRAAADRLLREGMRVTVNDISTTEDVREAAEVLRERGAESVLGSHDLTLLDGVDVVVVSPGVTPRLPLLREAEARSIPVWSEVELAWRLTRARMVAVTGTNGKTTTVSMIAWICNQAGMPAVAAGNIGYPLITAVEEAGEGTLLVAEVSSFQLSHIVEFRPAVAVLLNIGEDHFDWHANMDEYVAAKGRMWLNQHGDDMVVCNLDDDACARAAAGAPVDVLFFSMRPLEQAAVFMSGDTMYFRQPGTYGDGEAAREIMPARELQLPGDHNLENAMAAAAAAIALGVDPRAAGEALAGFRALPHRLQYLGEAGGAAFYEDSKATNPHAALRALGAFAGPLVVILGGRNKGLGFDGLAAELIRRADLGEVRAVYLIGEAAGEIAAAFGEEKERVKMMVVPGLEDVFADLPRTARAGDTVLFSPACASFDRYRDYEERGRHFQELFAAYRAGGSDGG